MKNLLVTSLLLFTLSGYSADAPIPDFTAKYTLYKAGLRAAVSTVTLKRTGPATWSYTSNASPVGLVSVFRSDKIHEQSLWSLVKNNIQVNEYTFSHKRGRKQKKYNHLAFNWKNNTAASQIKDSKKTIKLSPGALDKFTLQLRIMRDMTKNGKPAPSYSVTHKHQLKNWVFTLSGTEKVKTAKGTLDTVIIKRSRKNKKRTTYMYLAKKYNYLPVKIKHVEKNGSKFYMVLTGLTGFK